MARPFQTLAISLSLFAGLIIPTASQAQIAGVAPLVTQVTGASPAADGQVVHSESGRFSVQMPGNLQAATATTAVSGDTLTWTVSQARQGENFYAVAYTDLPLAVLAMGQEAVIDSLSHRPLVEGFDWQAIANRGRAVALEEIPGMEFLNLEDGRVSALRFYLANRRLYAVMASSLDLHAVNQFIDSFSIDSLWRPFTSEEGRFTVDLPMAPVVTPQQVIYQGTPLNWWQFTGYNLYAPEDFYGFAYADLPDGVPADNPNAILTEVATLVLTELDAAALAETGVSIDLDGYPGREYLLTTSNGNAYVLRLYLADRRLYGLLATSKSLNYLDLFLNSFQVQ